ncbi:MAG: M48 family peptidase [Gammaproteobacteria bacterium]|nr:MAG: M48 family peptidase [Gammaproteobacteria bacterium]
MKKTLLLAVLFLMPVFTISAQSVALPELGNRSSKYLSQKEEEDLKIRFLGSIYRSMKVIEDPEVVDYINTLGYKLVAASAENTLKFRFLVIDDDSINAFAGPGGVIGVHTGLIRAARDENELAAVLAHEVAHITQKHLARTFESVYRSSLPTAAAILAAIIVGRNSPQLGQAAITAATAGSVQGQLNFTREHEVEADAVGVQLLADAGFPPSGMINFFQRLNSKTDLVKSDVPEFLRTHPMTLSRIAQTRSRVAALKSKVAGHGDSEGFKALKVFLEVRHELETPASSHQDDDKNRDSGKKYYYIALKKLYRGDLAGAQKAVDVLLQKKPWELFYQVLQVRIFWAQDRYKEATRYLDELLKSQYQSQVLKYYLIQSYLFLDQVEKARQLLDEAMRSGKEDYLYLPYAKALERQGDVVEAHQVLADLYLRQGLFTEAIEQLSVAASQAEDEKRKKVIESRLAELRKRVSR